MPRVIKSWARQRLQGWLAKRQPPGNPVILQHSYMFVLPTAFGISVLVLLVLLYVLGTNYQNNLILLLAYALSVLWLSCILLVFFQLHGRWLSGPAELACFAGEQTSVVLSLTGRQLNGLLFARWWQPDSSWQPCGDQTLALPLTPVKRGRYLLPRVAIATEHPFGLLRCWVYLQLNSWLWVYPAPALATASAAPALPQTDSNDEWTGLKTWTPGHSMRQINWKRFARDGQLRCNLFGTTAPEQELWLTLNPRAGNFEAQLSDLTARVLQAQQQHLSFGVRLPTSVLGPGQGDSFVTKVLQALALC